MDILCPVVRSRPWRGNVRELQNVIEHTAVLLDPEQVIRPSDIPLYEDSAEEPGVEDRRVAVSASNDPYHVAKDRIVAHFEKEYLGALVARAGGNMSKAARLAGVDRTTLYRLMDKHQLIRGDAEAAGA